MMNHESTILHPAYGHVCFRQSNPDISNFMKKWNMTSDYHKLESIYIKKLLDIVSSYPTNNGYIVWQEVFDNGVAVKNDTVIHVWKVIWFYINVCQMHTSYLSQPSQPLVV